MSKMMLVSHEASRTGAPRIAVEVLRAAEGLVDERLVVIRWPGPLGSDLMAAADRSRLEPLRRTRVVLRRFARTSAAAIHLEEEVARRLVRREKPDIVYLNTVKSACYVRPALEIGCRVVLHSHEMDSLAAATLARYDLQSLYGRVRLVACSAPARRVLSEITGVADIEVIPSMVDSERLDRMSQETTGDRSISISRRPMVVACGTADDRKGADLWVHMAGEVRSLLGTDCPLFVWVGERGDAKYEKLAADLGLDSDVRFIGPSDNPYPVIRQASVFTLSSRQDAFPLAVLEAMALGTPVVAFDVGGIRDQLGATGMIIPPGDVPAMSRAVVGMLEDGEERRRLATAAGERVRAMYGIERFRKQIGSLVLSELRTGKTQRNRRLVG